jgi:hypothetical protein
MDPALETLILECLEKNPAKRPATAADLGLRLKQVSLAAGRATEIHAPLAPTELAMADTHKGFQPSEPGKIKRGRWRLVVLGASVGVALAMALGFYWQSLARRGAESAKQPSSVPFGATAVAPATVPVAQPSPAAEATTTEQTTPATVEAAPSVPPVHALESPPAGGTARKPAVAARTAAKHDPSVAPASAPADKGHKPSRAAREGLIQENPF